MNDVVQVAQQQIFDPVEFEATKNVVCRQTELVEGLKNDIKHINESLKNILINDSEYSELEEAAKTAKQALSKRKKELMDSNEAKSFITTKKEKTEERKDIEDSLSNHLLNLFSMTGVKEFETPDGEVREFKIKSKVMAAKSKGR